jgi:uncharacterized protein YndB with AHSA1/START domain
VLRERRGEPERAWLLWSDPRQLERWWGPPGFPATFTEHDFTPGGAARYFMTGPDGEKNVAWFRFLRLDAPSEIELDDGFGETPGEEPPGMPPTMRINVRLEESYGGTRMTITTAFASLEAMEQSLAMGMQEGMALALSQVDAILAG